MIILTGPLVEKLSLEVCRNVLFRINSISKSHQIQTLIFKWIKKSYESNLIQMLDQRDQNDFLETLYEYSFLESKLGLDSGKLYKMLTL